MKRLAMKGLVFFLLALLLGGCAPTKATLRKENKRLQKESEALTRQLAKGEAALEKMKAENAQIQKELEELAVSSEIRVQETKKGLVIIFLDQVLFDSGKAEIKESAFPILEKVAQIIRKHSKRGILIEGHTDDVPIGVGLRSKYQTNWELSTSRATSILRYLLEKYDLPPAQLSAVGYGEYHPVASNATEEGRAQNRRVEIVIQPERIVRESQ